MKKKISKIVTAVLIAGLYAGSAHANVMDNIQNYFARLQLKLKSYFQKPLTPIQKLEQSVFTAFQKQKFRRPKYLPKETLFKSKFHETQNQWNVVLYQKNSNKNESVDLTLDSYKYRLSQDKKHVLLRGHSSIDIKGITQESAKEQGFKNIEDAITTTVARELDEL